jgi:hypothetical protein
MREHRQLHPISAYDIPTRDALKKEVAAVREVAGSEKRSIAKTSSSERKPAMTAAVKRKNAIANESLSAS